VTVNVPLPQSIGAAPTFDLTPQAQVIRSDVEAIDIAEALIEFPIDAAKRDRERILPAAELDRFSKSGLWGITVPKAYGGAYFLTELSSPATNPPLPHHGRRDSEKHHSFKDAGD
jgi:alkylation response protein AidB-like acyl-CoA dehydrogenase